MSQLFAGLASGALQVVPDTKAPLAWRNGIGVDPGGLSVDPTSPINHYHMGLPMSVSGRVCVSVDEPVAYYGSGAAPFVGGGRIALGQGAVDHYHASVPYTATGQLAVDIVLPSAGDTLIESLIVAGQLNGSRVGYRQDDDGFAVPSEGPLVRLTQLYSRQMNRLYLFMENVNTGADLPQDVFDTLRLEGDGVDLTLQQTDADYSGERWRWDNTGVTLTVGAQYRLRIFT